VDMGIEESLYVHVHILG